MLHLVAVPLCLPLGLPLGLPTLLQPEGARLDLALAEVDLVEAAGPPLAIAPRGSLVSLMEGPEAQLGESSSVLVQFREEVLDWNPFLSRFTPETHRCFEFWGDEQWLWIEEEYRTPLARLHVRRGTIAEAVLDAARAHDRLELDVCVRELHAGSPWIEVTHAAQTEERMPEGSVLHAIRAMELIEREGWRLAISELDRALRPNLPGHVRRELETIRATCQETWDALQGREFR